MLLSAIDADSAWSGHPPDYRCVRHSALSRPREVRSVNCGRCPFEVVGGVPVVAAPDEIDVTNAPSLRSAMLEAAAYGRGTLVVDITATRFCDSSGLQALLAARKSALAEGGELLLVVGAPAVLRVFALTGVGHLISHFSSLDQALAQATAGRLNGRRGPDDREEIGLAAT
jgi:anti-sigma B factor antagonist